MLLSNQSKWYLRGNFPIVASRGHKLPTLEEIKELIEKDLVKLVNNKFYGNLEYHLTQKGKILKYHGGDFD